ncbi:uncharacterized protein LOC119326815 [Triticum dicoccoides]|uniref:uncharacterized protein LOC119326815 n=1 Tax=Triticum dicoccoides TaxID=85692 RepID=UPI001890E520|nr:uncharacterized protein LOC119326815 [Triticum dicoccoides]XP_044409576.1 uncharacterized protein LOC123134377 [Triticum aestivum]
MEGPFKGHPPHGCRIEFFGVRVFHVDEDTKVEKAEFFYERGNFLASFLVCAYYFCFCCIGFRLPCDERRLKRDGIDETCLSLASIVFRLSLSLLGGRRPSSAPCPSKRALDPPPQPRHRHRHRRPWRCSSVAQSSSQGGCPS